MMEYMRYRDNPGIGYSKYDCIHLSRLQPSEAVAVFKAGAEFGAIQTIVNLGGALLPQRNIIYRARPISDKFDRLITLSLSSSISFIIEPDSDGYIARTLDIPLYGFGDDTIEASDMLKAEIESLYFELMEDDDFSAEWLNIKKYLKTKIIPSSNEK